MRFKSFSRRCSRQAFHRHTHTWWFLPVLLAVLFGLSLISDCLRRWMRDNPVPILTLPPPPEAGYFVPAARGGHGVPVLAAAAQGANFSPVTALCL